jgi:hypothetical protein
MDYRSQSASFQWRQYSEDVPKVAKNLERVPIDLDPAHLVKRTPNVGEAGVARNGGDGIYMALIDDHMLCFTRDFAFWSIIEDLDKPYGRPFQIQWRLLEQHIIRIHRYHLTCISAVGLTALGLQAFCDQPNRHLRHRWGHNDSHWLRRGLKKPRILLGS